MSFDLPQTDMVYVQGLPAGITEKDIEEYFGSIGVRHCAGCYTWLLPANPPVWLPAVHGMQTGDQAGQEVEEAQDLAVP